MPKPGRPTTLPEPWRSLADKAGGVGALASRFGVAPVTLRRWAHGETRMLPVFRPIFDALKKTLDAAGGAPETKGRLPPRRGFKRQG